MKSDIYLVWVRYDAYDSALLAVCEVEELAKELCQTWETERYNGGPLTWEKTTYGFSAGSIDAQGYSVNKAKLNTLW